MLKSKAANLVLELERKTEYVNEQKENIKILVNNVDNYEMFIDRLSVSTYKTNSKRKSFLALKKFLAYRRKQKVFAHNFLKNSRKQKLISILRKWRNANLHTKKRKKGQNLVLSFKVI